MNNECALSQRTRSLPPWFRTWRCDLQDRVLQQLPTDLFKFAVNLRCLCDHLSGLLPSVADIAFALHLPVKQTEKKLTNLVVAGFLRRDGEAFVIGDWRQAASDDDASVKRRQREKRRTMSMDTSEDGAGLVFSQIREGDIDKEDNSLPPVESAPAGPDESLAGENTRTRRCRIRPDQQPEEPDRKVALDRGLSVADFRTEWVAFRDYHLARGSLMLDWSAAWRTWLSRTAQFSSRGASTIRAGSSGHESNFTKATRKLLMELGEEEPFASDASTNTIIDLEPIRMDRANDRIQRQRLAVA